MGNENFSYIHALHAHTCTYTRNMKNANFMSSPLFIQLNAVTVLVHHLHYYILMMDASQITVSYMYAYCFIEVCGSMDVGRLEFHSTVNINFNMTPFVLILHGWGWTGWWESTKSMFICIYPIWLMTSWLNIRFCKCFRSVVFSAQITCAYRFMAKRK